VPPGSRISVKHTYIERDGARESERERAREIERERERETCVPPGLADLEIADSAQPAPYICIYACIYMYTDVCMYMCTCTHTHTHTHTHTDLEIAHSALPPPYTIHTCRATVAYRHGSRAPGWCGV
jgi:hypothetical protein